MRFLHERAEGIVDFIESNSLSVFACQNDASQAPIPAQSALIATMLDQSLTLWGDTLRHYAIISSFSEINPVPLSKMVLAIEASPEWASFLIAAYNDGGLISVSGSLLPFQQEAKKADWWA
jgi:hypothetical protein